MRHARKIPSHGAWKFFGLVLVSLLAIVLGAGAAVYNNLQTNITREDVESRIGPSRPTKPTPTVTPTKPPSPQDPFPGQPLNILVMGSDTREGDNSGYGDVEGMRSDTTMLVHVSADRSWVEVVSIPRDSWVRIPSCSLQSGLQTAPRTTKFNAAFAYGGQQGDVGDAAACTIKTLESLTDIYIDQYMVVDFAGFIKIIDAVGGVEFCTPEDINAPKADLALNAGNHLLDGNTALGVMRARSGEGLNGSDIARIERQQQLLNSLVDKILSNQTLSNPPRLYGVLNSATSSLTTSPEIGELPNMAGLAYALRHLDKSNITFTTVPNAPRGDGANVVWTAEATELWDRIRADIPAYSLNPTAPSTPTDTGDTGVVEQESVEVPVDDNANSNAALCN